MVHHKVDTEGLEFDVILGDVESLNRAATQNTIDITKISYHAYFYVAKNYLLLDSGSALGRGNGPLLISQNRVSTQDVATRNIAIPGRTTTANLLLSLAFPNALKRTEYVFSDIEAALLDDEVDLGLIIHENRFTYADKGLRKVCDLGEFWEDTTGLPIPLGGIVVNRNLPDDIQQKVNRVLRRSVDFAFDNPLESLEFIRKYAQGMNEEVMYKHIELYVNEFTRSLGVEGRNAVHTLFRISQEKRILGALPEKIFLDLA
jgi:1,4-dihydroxy-6-naphthoate synthase